MFYVQNFKNIDIDMCPGPHLMRKSMLDVTQKAITYYSSGTLYAFYASSGLK